MVERAKRLLSVPSVRLSVSFLGLAAPVDCLVAGTREVCQLTLCEWMDCGETADEIL